MNNKLQAKDLINLGLFTVLYFVLGCCVAIPIGFVPIFLPILGALWTLITGIPFMLFLTRVKKFGMVTLMAILSGLLMGLTGMGYWGVPLGLIFGLLGDLILKFGNYKSAKRSLIGYAVFSLWMVGAPVRRTNVCEIGFHVQDFSAIVVCFACFILFFLHQYIVF